MGFIGEIRDFTPRIVEATDDYIAFAPHRFEVGYRDIAQARCNEEAGDYVRYLSDETAHEVVKIHRVGDLVSIGFNGDSYPYQIIGWSPSGKVIHLRPVRWGIRDEFLGDEVRSVTWRAKRGTWAEKGKSGWPISRGGSCGGSYRQNPYY